MFPELGPVQSSSSAEGRIKDGSEDDKSSCFEKGYA